MTGLLNMFFFFYRRLDQSSSEPGIGLLIGFVLAVSVHFRSFKRGLGLLLD